jgi:calcineurin-like phosphoesterase family protein
MKPYLKFNSADTNIFFTSDLHFGHKNIIEFCKRPFSSVEEMDETLIANWNSKIGVNDIVFDLGDFAFAPNWRWIELIGRLNGKHHLILGNHDVSRFPGDKVMSLFDSISYQMLIKIDDRYIYLNHYPFLCYAGTYGDNNTYQLFGHVHTNPRINTGRDKDRLVNLFPFQYDVGVDNNNYAPISWEEVDIIIKNQICQQKNISVTG